VENNTAASLKYLYGLGIKKALKNWATFSVAHVQSVLALQISE